MSDVRIAGFTTSLCERSLASHQSRHISGYHMSGNIVATYESVSQTMRKIEAQM